jgi:hypothetical protein
MTIEQIYNEYTPGSQGFCIAVETHCGFQTSRTETARIAAKAPTAAEFQSVWENDDSWTDENNDA